MHPETILYDRVPHLKCPSKDCGQVLSQIPLATITADGEIRIVWRCARCDKATELVVDISDSCWTLDGILMPTVRDG